MRLRMAMNEQLMMAVLIGFVNVFGWDNGDKTHRSRQHDSEETRREHEMILRDWGRRHN